ncbi:hypothetical protein OAZ91_00660 [bacterium]|nr:hypothetical protein [bacterium]
MKEQIKNIVLIFIAGMIFAGPSELSAQHIDTKWTVTGYSGELWFGKENQIIGKFQRFNKGWADGIFYSCNFGGQSKTYNSYNIQGFLKNREFFLFNKEKFFVKLFKEKSSETNISNIIFVHRVTCNGNNPSERRVFYPFITIKDSLRGFYLYEGAVIRFLRNKKF